jgi:hypothetical protein
MMMGENTHKTLGQNWARELGLGTNEGPKKQKAKKWREGKEGKKRGWQIFWKEWRMWGNPSSEVKIS